MLRPDTFEVASNLRPEDLSEAVEGWGPNPLIESLSPRREASVCLSWCLTARPPDCGIIDGQIWMMCTPAIHKYPVTFANKQKGLLILDQRNYSST